MYFTYSFSSSHRTSNIVDFLNTHSIKQILYAVALNSQCNAYLLVGHLLFKLITRQIVLGITNFIYIYILSHTIKFMKAYIISLSTTREQCIYTYFMVFETMLFRTFHLISHTQTCRQNVSPLRSPSTTRDNTEIHPRWQS